MKRPARDGHRRSRFNVVRWGERPNDGKRKMQLIRRVVTSTSHAHAPRDAIAGAGVRRAVALNLLTERLSSSPNAIDCTSPRTACQATLGVLNVGTQASAPVLSSHIDMLVAQIGRSIHMSASRLNGYPCTGRVQPSAKISSRTRVIIASRISRTRASG